MTTNTAENATAGVPVVRGLVWTRHPSHAIWRVDCLLGTYKVFAITDVIWTFDGFDGKADSGEAASAEDGFAICQAHHDERILSALNPDYASALDTARAEIERLTRERDELMAWFDGLSPSEMHDAIVRDKARIAELVAATDELLGDWPPGELPRRATAVRVAKALNAARTTLSPAVKEPK